MRHGEFDVWVDFINIFKQAGAELCQAQVNLVVIVDVVEEAWS